MSYGSTLGQGFQELSFPVPWGQMAAKAFGNPSGKQILAIHGWTDNAGTFDKLVPLLSNTFYVVALELPGHGKSSHFPPGVCYHHTEYIMSIRRVIRQLKWTKFSWLGHSLGAGFGALYAAFYPNEVDRLVMFDYVKLVSWETEDIAPRFSTFLGEFLALDKQRNKPPATYGFDALKNFYVQVSGGTLTDETAGILLKRGSIKISSNPDKWAFARDVCVRNPGSKKFSHEQIHGILSDIKCHMLMYKATDAAWFEPVEVCEKTIELYKSKCASFERVDVTGGHFFHLGIAGRIAPKINRFFLASN